MEFNNHKITEAAFAFEFLDNSIIIHNSELLISLTAALKNLGFSQIQIKKMPSIDIEITNNEFKTTQGKESLDIIFFDEKKAKAVVLGGNFISFHTINHYHGWEFFFPKAEEVLRAYKTTVGEIQLSLVQMTYVNTFKINDNENLSDFLNFVPKSSEFGQGVEISHNFQTRLKTNEHIELLIQASFNREKQQAQLQCTAIAKTNPSETYLTLAEKVHAQAVKTFKSSITDTFKNKIQ